MNSHQKEVDTLRYLHPQWAYYYGESVRSFRSQKNVYKSSIEHIDFDCPSVLAPDQPKRFVLGGFHPYNGTPEDFKRFCCELHLNPKDMHIYLDMNRLPLESIERRFGEYRIQALIESLPFNDSSVDFLFLDFTVDYMNDEQLKRLSQCSSVSLSPNGLMFITKTWPPDIKELQRKHPQLTLHPWYVGELIAMMPNLKLVGFSCGYDSSLITMARKDSPFKNYTLSPSDLREEYPWPK